MTRTATDQDQPDRLVDLISATDLQAQLPVGRTTFYELIKGDDFPEAYQLSPGGPYFYDRADILDWLASRRRRPGDGSVQSLRARRTSEAATIDMVPRRRRGQAA